MTAAERQEKAIHAAARVRIAKEHLAQALEAMQELGKDIGIRHHAETAIKIALRYTETADAVTTELCRAAGRAVKDRP